MKKILILGLSLALLSGCMSPEGQEAFVAEMETNVAKDFKVPISDIEIEFLQNCAVESVDDVASIFYAKAKNSDTVYQYHSGDCDARKLDSYTKTVYSEDGEMPTHKEEK